MPAAFNPIVTRCEDFHCSHLLFLEPRVVLEDPTTLTLLLAARRSVRVKARPVVGPLLKEKKNGKVNFVYEHGEVSQWDDIITSRTLRGSMRVAEVRMVRLVKKYSLELLMTDEGKVEQHVNTHIRPGYILSTKGFKEGKKHPDLWGLNNNKAMWARRYIHPHLYKIIAGEATAEELGPDLYYVPFFTERFCRELIEELEHFGKWQDKDKDDREESHLYTSTNINLSQIGFAQEYEMVVLSLKKELLATLYGGYRGVPQSTLLFVLKYSPNTHYNTFKYHLDGATYTFNIALNHNFTVRS
ncbi:hypothetical protein Pmani_031821 [Petrolisthes manimaculis]|uniref:Uncharacterized protein n=1 Tax=Petrolisthes manimaculis TaxID=1843537 RepID=A0AAE1NTW2_9EUCA|nr:hypothetical protein Pmani_031821 [Petrolisthes manimaculis]